MYTADAHYYLRTALQALEKAYTGNQDLTVATHISQAMDALHRLAHHAKSDVRAHHGATRDPYEMDEYNSAV